MKIPKPFIFCVACRSIRYNKHFKILMGKPLKKIPLCIDCAKDIAKLVGDNK